MLRAVGRGGVRVRFTVQLGGSTFFFLFFFWAAEQHRRNNINIILDADNYNCVRFRRSKGRTHCSMLMLRAVGRGGGGSCPLYGATRRKYGFFVFLFWAAELHRRNNINNILDADNYNCVRFRRSKGRTHCSMGSGVTSAEQNQHPWFHRCGGGGGGGVYIHVVKGALQIRR